MTNLVGIRYTRSNLSLISCRHDELLNQPKFVCEIVKFFWEVVVL